MDTQIKDISDLELSFSPLVVIDYQFALLSSLSTKANSIQDSSLFWMHTEGTDLNMTE